MRGAIQYFLFSGIAWFAAGLLFVASVALCTGDPAGRPRATRSVALRLPVARVLILLSIGLAALSGTPLPWWLAIPLLGATLAYAFVLKNRKVAAVATLLVAAAVFHEAQYFRFPSIEPPPKKVAVIGDSISSGGFSETTAWPNLLSIPAVNLSMPSETVRSALDNQASRLAETGADLVVVEIGGNDMLGGTSPRDFARDLERLLRMAVERRRVVMLELPLLPGKWSFGAAQRRLARKYGVILVPKRVLARVLTSADHTSDALHLTQRGHDELAKKIGHALGARARADR